MSEEIKRRSEEGEEKVVEVPLRPVSREDIRRLETALLIASLFTPEFLELLKSGERLTWIDSLATAAGALAREKAGMTIREIAEELGKTEATIRKHLKGETKAGQIVLKTYERFLKEGVKIELPFPLTGAVTSTDVEQLKKQVEELKAKVREYEEKLKECQDKTSRLEQELAECRERLEAIRKALGQ